MAVILKSNDSFSDLEKKIKEDGTVFINGEYKNISVENKDYEKIEGILNTKESVPSLDGTLGSESLKEFAIPITSKEKIENYFWNLQKRIFNRQESAVNFSYDLFDEKFYTNLTITSEFETIQENSEKIYPVYRVLLKEADNIENLNIFAIFRGIPVPYRKTILQRKDSKVLSILFVYPEYLLNRYDENSKSIEKINIQINANINTLQGVNLFPSESNSFSNLGNLNIII